MPANAKALKGQLFLFTNTDQRKRWKPPSELPSLDGITELAIDEETTGKDKFKDVPVGTAIRLPDGRKFYFPTGHAGGNMDPEQVKRWKLGELRNKKIVNINTGFDAEVERNGGVDLEAQGCTLHDVAHAAALLNENRYSGFNLNDLGLEYCKKPKRDDHLEKDRMADYHSSMVGAYAEDDADLAWEVYQAQKPLLEKDNLGKVMQLEDDLIWTNNHIERNGARLDVPKLQRFTSELFLELQEHVLNIWSKTGVRLDPGKNATWDRLFIQQGMDPHKVLNDKQQSTSSYTEDYLKTFKDNPIIAEGLRCRRLLSLNSRYFAKYEKARKGDRLPFQLYQLRAGEDDGGTVVGRYSSANVNIQQVFKVANQIRRFGNSLIVRELIIPDDGFEMFTADGSQLQYRLFAHLSQDRDIIKAYHEGYARWLAGGHDVDYHQMVADLFHLSREEAKTQNFGIVMGLGAQSLAINLDLACTCETPEYWAYIEGNDYDESKKFSNNDNHAYDCPALKANDMSAEYHRRNPSAKKTLDYVQKFAKKQGFVPSLLGRRRRYDNTEYRLGVKQKTRYYKALATWLQGSEADIVKTKLLHVYRERKTLGIHKLRMPVHDELTGDRIPEEVYRKRLRELLKEQDIPCRVPISWQDEYGANWRVCSGK